jgi:uncharacterized protein YkwD
MIAVGGMLCLEGQPLRSMVRSPAWGFQVTGPEAELYHALNQYRGGPPLRLDPALMAAARGRTNAVYKGGGSGFGVLRRGSGHNVNGQNPMAAARSAGYRGNSVGENLAWGSSPAATVNPQWANSRGHNRNQLDNWRDVGVAVGDGTNGNARVAIFGR